MPDFARSADPAVQAELDLLSKLSPGGDRLGLDRITRLLDRLGRPQDSLPPVLHVAGTNGKGSACAFLRAALEAAESPDVKSAAEQLAKKARERGIEPKP